MAGEEEVEAGEIETIEEEQDSPGRALALETETTSETEEDAETSLLHIREKIKPGLLSTRDLNCKLRPHCRRCTCVYQVIFNPKISQSWISVYNNLFC